MSRNGITRMSPPMKSITNPLTRVSEQDSFNKVDVSQKKVRNHIVSTEGQRGHEQGVQRGMGSGQHPGQRQQRETEPGAHDGSVVQGEADGHIAVIGHGHKQEALKNSKKQVKIHLGQTACIGDGQGMALHILQQLRHSDREEAEVRERQITEK